MYIVTSWFPSFEHYLLTLHLKRRGFFVFHTHTHTHTHPETILIIYVNSIFSFLKLVKKNLWFLVFEIHYSEYLVDSFHLTHAQWCGKIVLIYFFEARQSFIFSSAVLILGFPWWLNGKESACQFRRCRFNTWVRKIPWRRKWQPTLVFLPGKPHWQRCLVGYSPWGHKESETTSWLNNNNSNVGMLLGHLIKNFFSLFTLYFLILLL